MKSIQFYKYIVGIINSLFPCPSLLSFGKFIFLKLLFFCHFKHVVGVTDPNVQSKDQGQVVIEPVPLLVPAPLFYYVGLWMLQLFSNWKTAVLSLM